MEPAAAPVRTPQTVDGLAAAARALTPGSAAQLGHGLSRLVGATATPDRLDAFVDVLTWTREGDEDAGIRMRAFLDLLAGDEALRAGVLDALAAILVETTGENLFAETGMPGHRGFLTELMDRTLQQALPAPRDDHDLARLLRRLFPTRRAAERLVLFPPEAFAELLRLLFPAERADDHRALADAFADGFRLLAVRVVAEGLTERVRARSPHGPVDETPFFRFGRASGQLMDAWTGRGDVAGAAAAWREARASCRERMAEIVRRLDTEGVSVDIVYGLEVVDRCLHRMSLMVEVLEAGSGERFGATVHRLLTRLALASHEDRSVVSLVRWNLHLLGRKIVERAGETGEHYIARTRGEYWHIWVAAAGGGLVTTFTAAMKMAILAAGLALFQEGVAASLNYAVSFLILQAFGLILATKQPAITGATLARLIREHQGSDRLDVIVDYATRICHSQIAAAISNIIVVSAGAFAFDALWRLRAGQPFLSSDAAHHVYQTLSPFASGTIFYAALTGVLLWLGSLAGGWFDNWSVSHRLPQAIREHWLGRVVGKTTLGRAADLWARNAGGIGTNVSLGALLGMTPALGLFLGLPLDVRHVTLSTGTLALGASALGPEWFLDGWFLRAALGVAVMFVLNLGVSFSLALITAARAYGLPRGDLPEVARRLGRQLRRRPLDFLMPISGGPVAPAEGM